ncbi:MAG: N-6 DNA methylase [bacterium]|jgi:hypothetical protein
MPIKTTEREVAGWLSEQINKVIEGGGYPFNESTIETGLPGNSSRFPDIVLWISRQDNNAFAFFELKAPGLTENTGRLIEVAERLKVNHAVTWNFAEAVLYYINRGIELKKRYATHVISDLEEWKRADIRILLKKHIERFLSDLTELHRQGHLHKFPVDKYFFISLLNDATERLHGHFLEHLTIARKDKRLGQLISEFQVRQGIPDVGGQETNSLLARQWAYGFVTRIVFYLTLRRFHSTLPDIIAESKNTVSINKLVLSAFEAARRIDWQAVFENDDPISLVGVPDKCGPVLSDLLVRLGEFSFEELKVDVIGEIFESLIPETKKKELGQYFTREDLVDLILGFVIQDSSGYYCDPTCGSGTFLTRAYSRLKWLSGYRKRHPELLTQLWGFDVARFPAELATINLFRQDMANYANFPRIDVQDFFDLRVGTVLEFPPARLEPGKMRKEEVAIPQFKGLFGNFPFIRQEQIEKTIPGYKNAVAKSIAFDWFKEYRDIFEIPRSNGAEYNAINEYPEEKLRKYLTDNVTGGNISVRLSGQADIYAYLYLHAARFLTDGGRMAFITSNSYLDVRYGYHLKRFFAEKFKIIAVVASWVEPWFDFASINTVFTVLERCDDQNERQSNVTKFVKLKKKLEELIPFRQLEWEEDRRWNLINQIVQRIETAQIPRRSAPQKQLTNGVACTDDNDFQIRMVPQSFLLADLKVAAESSKWGQFLRAPSIYFDLCTELKDVLVPLGSRGEIRRGITTGINDFFYLQSVGRKAKKKGLIAVKNGKDEVFEIEEQFLRHVIKSPKDSDSILIDPSKLRTWIFLCSMSKSALKRAGLRGALQYVEWGESMATDSGVPWAKVPSVSTRTHWWYLPDTPSGSILLQRINNDRFLAFNNKYHVKVDCNLYEFEPKSKRTELECALLNSSIVALSREIVSRVNLGDGATKTEGVDWEHNVLAIDSARINQASAKNIVTLYRKMEKRPILAIGHEMKRKDRVEFDKSVLTALGLDPDYYLDEIYKSLCSLVQERLSLPKMRKKVKKHKIDLSIEEVKKAVESELLPNGLRPFPESFIPAGSGYQFIEKDIGNQPLSIGHHFFGKYEIVNTDGGKVTEANSQNEALFIISAQKPDETIIKVPKNQKVTAQAVAKYEKYIKATFEKLATRAYAGTGNRDMADKIAKEILKENGYNDAFNL